MYTADNIEVARHLENIGVDIIRGGFATWLRDDLGFQANDENVDRALVRVQSIVADGRTPSIHDLTVTIAVEMSAESHIDAFGGSAWSMDW